jgi:hypothetical protein
VIYFLQKNRRLFFQGKGCASGFGLKRRDVIRVLSDADLALLAAAVGLSGDFKF